MSTIDRVVGDITDSGSPRRMTRYEVVKDLLLKSDL